MKKKWLFIIGGAIVLAVFVVLALKTGGTKKTVVTAEMADKGEITSVVTATGKVKAQADVQISADVMGRIIGLPVKEGDTVKTGQILLKIDSKSPEMNVAEAKGALLSAKSALETAHLTLDREKQLFSKHLISQSQLDIDQSTFDQAAAQVQVCDATFDRAQDQLDKCTIKAPMAGVITKLNSELGENVVIGTMNASGTVIMIISDLSAIEIEAEVDETDIASVRPDEDVKITLDAFPDTTFKGHVIEVGNSAQSSTLGLTTDQVTNFIVKVLLTDQVTNIKPGMTASVDITTAHRDEAVKVPSGAVVMRPEGTEKEEYVAPGKKPNGAEAKTVSDELVINKKDRKDVDGIFVVRGGKAQFVPVKTGIRDQQSVEIVSGLSEKDSVITGPFKTLRLLKQGEPISPQKPKFSVGSDSTKVHIS
jgi:HlyD family secretion protein